MSSAEAGRGRRLRTSTIATAAAFGTYFAMYGFRKPFTAATFEGPDILGFDRKTLLVSAQVLGYTLSKFLGIAIVAAMPPLRRAASLLAFVAIAELALLGFAIAPEPWNIAFLFLNGLPLGMVFGLVLGFLEGRRHTEAMAAGLCASFILAGGAMKSVGTWLLELGVAEAWMPCLAGALFLVPLWGCVAILRRIPAPDAEDVEQRSARSPMSSGDRRAFFRRYGRGLVPLIAAYLLVTIVRGLRDDFAPELWHQLGESAVPVLFTRSELLVAAGVLVLTGLAVVIRDNRRAFRAAMAIGIGGFALCGLMLLLQCFGHAPPFTFMVTMGLGLYLPYVAVHTTVFERLVAMTRDRGNIGYLMYLADSFGYLGYVVLMLGRSRIASTGDGLLDSFLWTTGIVATLGIACFATSWWWFAWRTRTGPNVGTATPPPALT
ncbi:MAG: hypothetical protein KDE27_23585 [Planctomycetes bacterium]|nr:hypothetical protein [Planctomycetota bacterium]